MGFSGVGSVGAGFSAAALSVYIAFLRWGCQVHAGWQLKSNRPWRVATNVGAGVASDAPRGRRSISRAQKNSRRALGRLNPIP